MFHASIYFMLTTSLRKRNMRKSTFILACLLLCSVPAYADNNPAMFGNAPAVMNNTNETQMRDLQIEKKYVQTVPKDLEAEKAEFEKSKKKDFINGNLTYNPQFKLNKVIFKGNTVYNDKKLAKLTSKLVGKDVYLEDVMDLAVEISRYYQRNGYLTSYAYIAPQEIKDGVVVIDIKESKVAQKEVKGNRWEKEWYLKNIAMGGKGLNTGDVFNARTLQGDMKDMNKEAYLKGSAEISKNKNDDTVVKLNVADRFPISFDFGWDDFGRDYTGRQRATGILGIDNFLGFGDRIYGGAILSSGSQGAVAGYQIPVNKYGTKLSFDYQYSKIELGGPYQGSGINGNASSYGLKLIHPLINTATKNLVASVGVDAVSSTTNGTGMPPSLATYNLRVLRTALYGMFDDKNGRTISSVGVDMGTNALGASEGIDNGPQSVFYKVIASLARIQRLPKDCLGIFRINGQYSPQALYAAEQMYLGGVYSLRGYQPSELLGDYGISGTLELRTPVPGLKKILPQKVKYLSDRVKLAAFYDWGYVKEYNDMYNYPTNFLSSVGFGTYINVTQAIYVQMGVGIPLGPKHLSENSGRFYFSVNTDIDRIFMKPKERL